MLSKNNIDFEVYPTIGPTTMWFHDEMVIHGVNEITRVLKMMGINNV